MMNRMQPVRLALIGLLVLFMASAFGQSVTGKLLGTILDPSGAAVPAAQLTVTSQETGIVTKLQSDNAGNYIAPSLPPGTYTVRVEAQGFRAAVASGNAVNVAQTTRVDVMLQVGQVAESVEVKAVAALVQSTTSDLGETVQQKQVQTLPLNGRIFSQLVQLMPGSLPSGQGGGDPEAGAGAGARIAINASVNGISTAGNRFTVDGVSNSEPMNGWISISPPVEAIEEFKVQTSNPGAEFGVFGGAVVNLTMRSGSNEIHGSLFEYLRNDKLNAKPFFSTVKAPWKTNQFGGTLGGPIVRNKFFIFGDYQGMRLRQGNTYNLSVPTASMQQGILLPQEGFAGLRPRLKFHRRRRHTVPEQHDPIRPLGPGHEKGHGAVAAAQPGGDARRSVLEFRHQHQRRANCERVRYQGRLSVRQTRPHFPARILFQAQPRRCSSL